MQLKNLYKSKGFQSYGGEFESPNTMYEENLFLNTQRLNNNNNCGSLENKNEDPDQSLL